VNFVFMLLIYLGRYGKMAAVAVFHQRYLLPLIFTAIVQYLWKYSWT